MLLLQRNVGECVVIKFGDEEVYIRVLEAGDDEYGKAGTRLGFIANRRVEITRDNLKGRSLELDLTKFDEISKEDKDKLSEWHEEAKRRRKT